jgi:hypothetical protein
MQSTTTQATVGSTREFFLLFFSALSSDTSTPRGAPFRRRLFRKHGPPATYCHARVPTHRYTHTYTPTHTPTDAHPHTNTHTRTPTPTPTPTRHTTHSANHAHALTPAHAWWRTGTATSRSSRTSNMWPTRSCTSSQHSRPSRRQSTTFRGGPNHDPCKARARRMQSRKTLTVKDESRWHTCSAMAMTSTNSSSSGLSRRC